ncbi:hypothetical protein RND71_040518 [Anisodus tanguticus]|uniref:Ribosomal protein L2 n=1 Tax=Anisodus tanguticus TaxID=243964 RepID=A0AAE1UTF2_9SOLA|nr:hypothetical protein RND71_040518 [Anisodus tanguticus]
MQDDRRVRSPRKILESTTTTICGPFSFSSLPGKGDQRKVACFSPGRMATYVVVGLPTRMPSWSKSPFLTSKDAGSKKTCAKDVFFSALSSPKAKGETASLSFDSSFGFPRIAVAGAKPAFFAPRMREKVRGKWRTHSILWVHRIKRKAALSWQSFRRQETLGLVGASSVTNRSRRWIKGSTKMQLQSDAGIKSRRRDVRRILGLDEWPATFYVRRAKSPGHSGMNQCE